MLLGCWLLAWALVTITDAREEIERLKMEVAMASDVSKTPQVRIDCGHDVNARIALAAIQRLEELQLCPVCERRRAPPGRASQ